MLAIDTINFFGIDAKFHHIGMVVKSIASIQPNIKIFSDPVQKVKIAFIYINGIGIELIEPIGCDSPVMESLYKGNKLPHICFEVPELGSSIKECAQHGFYCIAKPVHAEAFQRKIAWVFSKDYGLIELLQSAAG